MEDASESKTEYLSFLEDEESENVYKIRVMLMVDENRQRFIIIITINDLRKKYRIRTKALLNNYCEEELSLKRALMECVLDVNSIYANNYDDFFVGFEENFGSHHVTPRTINSKFLVIVHIFLRHWRGRLHGSRSRPYDQSAALLVRSHPPTGQSARRIHGPRPPHGQLVISAARQFGSLRGERPIHTPVAAVRAPSCPF
ncbi:hypothetical protein QTP88_013159 [Uroleucon formosanum]